MPPQRAVPPGAEPRLATPSVQGECAPLVVIPRTRGGPAVTATHTISRRCPRHGRAVIADRARQRAADIVLRPRAQRRSGASQPSCQSGIPTATGTGTWQAAQVSRLLARNRYCGQLLVPRVLNFLMTTTEARRTLATAGGGIRASVWIGVLRRTPRSRRCGIDEAHRQCAREHKCHKTDHGMFLLPV
jgi:hypothetical protein